MNNTKVASELLRIAKSLMGRDLSNDLVERFMWHLERELLDGSEDIYCDEKVNIDFDIDLSEREPSLDKGEVLDNVAILVFHLKDLRKMMTLNNVDNESLKKLEPYFVKHLKGKELSFWASSSPYNAAVPIVGKVGKVWIKNKALYIRMDGIDIDDNSEFWDDNLTESIARRIYEDKYR